MTIKELIETIYDRWGNAIKSSVKGYSMENSTTVTNLPYVTMYFMGIPTGASVLEENVSTNLDKIKTIPVRRGC